MNLRIEYTAKDIEKLIAVDIERRTGRSINVADVTIQVKSKQNYKAEWEIAEFKGVYHVVE